MDICKKKRIRPDEIIESQVPPGQIAKCTRREEKENWQREMVISEDEELEDEGAGNNDLTGTTRYCHFFNNGECSKPDCAFVHELSPKCRMYMLKGHCHRRLCMYRHEREVADEDRRQVGNGSFRHGNNDPSGKRRYCHFFNNSQKGCSMTPQQCPFLHEQSPVCKDFLNGQCNRKLCSFRHKQDSFHDGRRIRPEEKFGTMSMERAQRSYKGPSRQKESGQNGETTNVKENIVHVQMHNREKGDKNSKEKTDTMKREQLKSRKSQNQEY